MDQIHPEDMQEISGNFYLKLLDSMVKHSVEEIRKFKFSFTYRFKRKDNVWVKFLQNYVFLEIHEEKDPLLLLNFVSDITPYKKDNKVIFFFSSFGNNSSIMDMVTKSFNVYSKTSKRENEIILYIANGTKTKEIAEKMHLSVFTIRAHKRNIFEKTGTKNIAQLSTYAFANGIL
jgi:DNA-binding CsgD family transcriptional regulator